MTYGARCKTWSCYAMPRCGAMRRCQRYALLRHGANIKQCVAPCNAVSLERGRGGASVLHKFRSNPPTLES
eukprot:3277171-Pyramimonas_sp.AAC.3